jgi:mono/diheme cytochrome c family protein
LLAIIADGGDPAYNSKMPAFRDELTEPERRAVLEFIKNTWGREEAEFQWWMTATESGA